MILVSFGFGHQVNARSVEPFMVISGPTYSDEYNGTKTITFTCSIGGGWSGFCTTPSDGWNIYGSEFRKIVSSDTSGTIEFEGSGTMGPEDNETRNYSVTFDSSCIDTSYCVDKTGAWKLTADDKYECERQGYSWIEQEQCSSDPTPTPVNGGWSSWSDTTRGACNSSTGEQTRTGTRTCTNPSPANGGASCSGSSSRTQTRNCAVDGGWTSYNYGEWSTCNSSTSQQTRTGTRTCTNPSPKNGGDQCTGDAVNTQSQSCTPSNVDTTCQEYNDDATCQEYEEVVIPGCQIGTRFFNWMLEEECDYEGGTMGSVTMETGNCSIYNDDATCKVHTPINGSCSTSNSTCDSGSYVNKTNSGGYSRWQCSGSHGGTTDTCSYRTDYTAPTGTVSYSPSGWTNDDVTVTVTCSDTGGAGCVSETYTKTVSENESGSITISDNLGNTRNVSYDVTNIDKIVPTGNISHNTGWYNSSQTITFSAKDIGGSKLKRMRLQRSLNGGTYTYITGTDYNNLNSTSTVEKSYNQSAINENTYKYRLIAWDYATNSATFYGPTSELKFDTVAPSAPTISSTTHSKSSWTNNNDPYFSISANGEGPSPATNYYCFDTNNTCNPSISGNNNNYTNVAEGKNYFRAKTCDTGGCSSISSFEILIDTVNPASSDISVVSGYPVSGDTLHANTRQFSYQVTNNGFSPIVKIEGYLENVDTPDSYASSDKKTSNSSTLTFNGNITKVDNDGSNDGVRQYTFVITKIEDEAGNSFSTNTASPIKTYLYKVYANPDSTLQTSIEENDLSTGNLANGSIQNLILKVFDEYGNMIIPQSDINRTIDFDFTIQNTLKLNQYNAGSSDSSIYLNIPNGSNNFDNTIFNTGDNTYSNVTSNTGEYNFEYKVYTPTFDATETNGQEYVNGGANIENISIKIFQDPGVNLNVKSEFTSLIDGSNNITFDFAPIITSRFEGDFARSYSINQDLENKIGFNYSNLAGISNQKLFLGFGKVVSDTNVSHDSLDYQFEGSNISEGHQTNISNLKNFSGFTEKTFNSEIKQTQPGLTDEEKKHYISTHIGYMIDGIQVIYNSAIIGKNNYSQGTLLESSTNLGVKVLGNVQSKNQDDISDGQTGTDIYQLGNNIKADLKEQIRKNVAEISRSVEPKEVSNISNLGGNSWNTTIDAPKLLNQKVLLTTGNPKISGTYSGNKTLVIKGGNLYITSDLIANNKASDILGIIVLEDEDGNGGNVYVDPSVHTVQAIIYADKSLLNYDGSQVVTDSIQLENQFYFYGTLFSENTLGGYVSQVCPYFVDNCTQDESQKYDLNFFRSYYTYDGDDDGNRDETNGNPFFIYPDSNFDYPVIFEYNPNIQNNAPTLFEIE